MCVFLLFFLLLFTNPTRKINNYVDKNKQLQSVCVCVCVYVCVCVSACM